MTVYSVLAYILLLIISGQAIPSVPVRLVEGSSADYVGVVEVYHNEKWGLVCGNNWGDFDAQVSEYV